MKTFLEKFPFRHLFALLRKMGCDTDRYYYESIFKIKKRIIRKHIPSSLEYLNNANFHWQPIAKDAPIYFLWWQGFSEMPPIPKLCYSQLMKCNGDHPIVFIDKNNIEIVSKEYNVPIPEIYNQWRETGKISIQYFSDLLRTRLISNGGIWIDSTVFLTKHIDDILLTPEFYSGKRTRSKTGDACVSHNLWCSYFFAAGMNNTLIKFINMGLQEIVENFGGIPEYLTHDFLFKIANEESEYIHSYITAIPPLRPLFWNFVEVDQPMSVGTFDQKITESPFYKLNWRSTGRMHDNTGNPTIFNHLKEWSKKYTV